MRLRLRVSLAVANEKGTVAQTISVGFCWRLSGQYSEHSLDYTLRRAVLAIGNPAAASADVLVQKYEFVRDVLETRTDKSHMQMLIDFAFGADPNVQRTMQDW